MSLIGETDPTAATALYAKFGPGSAVRSGKPIGILPLTTPGSVNPLKPGSA